MRQRRGVATDLWTRPRATWSLALDSVTRSRRIQTYKEQVASCNEVCEALSKELDNAELSEDERLAIGHRWEQAMKGSHALQFMLDHLEEEEKAGK
jgi:hypothetical protein